MIKMTKKILSLILASALVLTMSIGVFAADDAGKARNEKQGQGEDDVALAAAQQGDQHQRQQDARKGGDDVGDAHEHLVDPAAVPAGEGADEDAEEEPRRHGAHRDEERGARALKHPGCFGL